MKYEEVERHVGRQVYLESFSSSRWLIYKAYGTIESISPYVAVFVPTKVMACMNPMYRHMSPIPMPTVAIGKICAILTAEDIYDGLLHKEVCGPMGKEE